MTAKWIIFTNYFFEDGMKCKEVVHYCSNCETYNENMPDVCPDCGAKMIGKEEKSNDYY